MPRIIRAAAWRSEDTVALARALLGRILAVRPPGGATVRRRITEVEAYHGPEDLACHASKGRTNRTEVMFQPGGVWYVYLVYGMHEMLNLVTGPRGFPAAILIRGVEQLTGPGRLTRALGIGRHLNGLPARRATGLWLEDDGLWLPDGEVIATPRIGIDYAGPIWSAKPWRFAWTPSAAKF